MFYILSFFFGESIGSFVQVFVSRLHVAPIIKGRSKCLSCGEALRVTDLIPLVSYVTLEGKCKYCRTPYGVESVIVEVLYGIVFVLLYGVILSGQTTLLLSFLYLAYYSVLFALLGIIALYDRKHTYIPVPMLFLFCFLTLGMLFVRYVTEPSLTILVSPLVTALPFLFLWLITKGKGVGLGDVFLFLGVGAFFGIEQSFAVLMISVWIGAVFGSVMYVKNKKKNKKVNTEIPFVPFIVIAFLVVLFTDIDILTIANVLGKWYH